MTRFRQRVEILLKAHDDPGRFMMSPIAGLALVVTALVEDSPTEHLGTMIGPYKLLEPIGEGGMGWSLWPSSRDRSSARRTQDYQARHGLRQVIARFEAERQALAMMDHPILPRYSTAARPGIGTARYFVMELVKGTPITDLRCTA